MRFVYIWQSNHFNSKQLHRAIITSWPSPPPHRSPCFKFELHRVSNSPCNCSSFVVTLPRERIIPLCTFLPTSHAVRVLRTTFAVTRSRRFPFLPPWTSFEGWVVHFSTLPRTFVPKIQARPRWRHCETGKNFTDILTPSRYFSLRPSAARPRLRKYTRNSVINVPNSTHGEY